MTLLSQLNVQCTWRILQLEAIGVLSLVVTQVTNLWLPLLYPVYGLVHLVFHL